jgi:hypothetical protein
MQLEEDLFKCVGGDITFLAEWVGPRRISDLQPYYGQGYRQM